MPGFILNTGSTVICPHGGSVSIVTSNGRSRSAVSQR